MTTRNTFLMRSRMPLGAPSGRVDYIRVVDRDTLNAIEVIEGPGKVLGACKAHRKTCRALGK